VPLELLPLALLPLALLPLALLLVVVLVPVPLELALVPVPLPLDPPPVPVPPPVVPAPPDPDPAGADPVEPAPSKVPDPVLEVLLAPGGSGCGLKTQPTAAVTANTTRRRRFRMGAASYRATGGPRPCACNRMETPRAAARGRHRMARRRTSGSVGAAARED
jgi:hypothetical protein